MEFFSNVMVKILSGSGFAALPTDWRQLVMILVACVLLYLGIRKGFEPLDYRQMVIDPPAESR